MKWTSLLVIGLALSCSKKGGEPYYIESPPVTLMVGSEGHLQVKFHGRNGYHWNEEFPAKFEVMQAPQLELGKERFTAEDFLAQGGVGVLEIAVKAQEQGQKVLRGSADFSVCNEKECRIFRGITVEVLVDVER